MPQGAGVLVGPGDDAAVLAAPDRRVVVTTDLLVDGVHFRRDWSSGYDAGRKAAAQNLADVAAMGARPSALLLGLATPGELALEWVDQLVDGLRDECDLVGAGVVGGDVVRSDRLTLAVSALGDLQGRSPVTRTGARPGELVVVAGRLGFAAAGLALLEAGRADAPLAAAHRRPEVAYGAAEVLAGAGASALVDVSDGLLADLGHVAERSGVGIELVRTDLPLAPELVRAGSELGVDPLGWVVAGGDDHAFAAALPAAALERARKEIAELPGRVPFSRIGRVRSGRGVSLPGTTPAQASGHEHFR